MNKLTSALAAFLVLGSASVALADDLATDQAADAIRNYGPVASVQAPLVTRQVAHRTVQQNDTSWMDRASQSFSGGY